MLSIDLWYWTWDDLYQPQNMHMSLKCVYTYISVYIHTHVDQVQEMNHLSLVNGCLSRFTRAAAAGKQRSKQVLEVYINLREVCFRGRTQSNEKVQRLPNSSRIWRQERWIGITMNNQSPEGRRMLTNTPNSMQSTTKKVYTQPRPRSNSVNWAP